MLRIITVRPAYVMRIPCAWRRQVKGAWGEDVHLVIAGLTNTYSSYITTFEEYGVQRYEGASTLYGPHTLDAYIQVQALFECQDSNESVSRVHGAGTEQLPRCHGPKAARSAATCAISHGVRVLGSLGHLQ